MRGVLRLFLTLLAALALGALVPMGLLTWSYLENPERFLWNFQWEEGTLRDLLLFLLLPVGNAIVGFSMGSQRGRGWALLPLSLAWPALAAVSSAGDPKGPIVIGLALVPACITWLAGRMGQQIRGSGREAER